MHVIDWKTSLQIDHDVANNELNTLDTLAVGLNALALQVSMFENQIREYENTNRKHVKFFGMEIPDHFGLPIVADQLLPCIFHWYGTSVCNYVRLVGFLDGLANRQFTREDLAIPEHHEKISSHCTNYQRSVSEIESILYWRNKVFAHFAITDPRTRDNAALLDVSAMSPIAYSESRFRVGGMVIMTRGAEIEMPCWSVTESYERLAVRYWPKMQ